MPTLWTNRLPRYLGVSVLFSHFQKGRFTHNAAQLNTEFDNIIFGVITQFQLKPGAIARSVAMSLGNQEAPRSILASGTSFREDLVMKIYGHSSSSADSRRACVS